MLGKEELRVLEDKLEYLDERLNVCSSTIRDLLVPTFDIITNKSEQKTNVASWHKRWVEINVYGKTIVLWSTKPNNPNFNRITEVGTEEYNSFLAWMWQPVNIREKYLY